MGKRHYIYFVRIVFNRIPIVFQWQKFIDLISGNESMASNCIKFRIEIRWSGTKETNISELFSSQIRAHDTQKNSRKFLSLFSLRIKGMIEANASPRPTVTRELLNLRNEFHLEEKWNTWFYNETIKLCEPSRESNTCARILFYWIVILRPSQDCRKSRTINGIIFCKTRWIRRWHCALHIF